MSLYNLADTSYKKQVFYNTGYWVKPQGITMIFAWLNRLIKSGNLHP
jgi:hypothetical protein